MKKVSLAETAVQEVSHNPEIGKRVLLASGAVPGITSLSQALLAPGQAAAEHVHEDMYEVFLVLAGHGSIVVDGRPCLLSEGDCVVIEPGESHEIINNSEADMVLTYFGVVSAKGTP